MPLAPETPALGALGQVESSNACSLRPSGRPKDLYRVEPVRVWAVRGAGAEHPLLGLRDIVTGMHAKHIPGGHDQAPVTPPLRRAVTPAGGDTVIGLSSLSGRGT